MEPLDGIDLVDARVEAGLSFKEAKEKSGLRFLRAYEQGDIPLSPQAKEKLGALYGVDPEQLVCDPDYRDVQELDDFRKKHPLVDNHTLQIRYLRITRGYTQGELSKEAGVGVREVERCEAGQKHMSRDTYERCLDVFLREDCFLQEMWTKAWRAGLV